MPEALIGTTIGDRYRIERLIGRGATGSVYEAEDTRIGRPVALKVLDRNLARDEQLRARFIREPRHAAGIRHPNIVPVTDAGDDDGRLYIVMQLIEGADLARILRAPEPLPPARAIGLLAQAAAGLDAAHAAHRIHRDVKPANILVGQADAVFLTDFGLARNTEPDVAMTAPGRFLGTVAYAAREQLIGGEIDARTDIYSFACVAFECLSGKLPFERDSDFRTAQAHVNDTPPALSAVRPGLPSALDATFRRALAKEPDDRFQTAAALVDEIREAFAESTDAAPSRAQARPARARRFRIALLVAGTVAAAAAAGTVIGSRDGGPPAAAAPAGKPHVLTSAAVRVRIPAGWVERSPPAGAATSGLLEPVEARPPNGSGHAVVVAASPLGRDPADPLTGAMTRANPKLSPPTRLRLGSIDALRYEAVILPGVAGPAVLYVLPGTTRIVYVACLADDSASPAFLATCERIASTARSTTGHPVSIVSSAAYAQSIERLVGRLRTLMPRNHSALVRARTRALQRKAAHTAANDYHRMELELNKLKAGPAAAHLHAELQRRVAITSSDYADLAVAAQAGKTSAWNAAARRLRSDEPGIAAAANDLLAAILVVQTTS